LREARFDAKITDVASVNAGIVDWLVNDCPHRLGLRSNIVPSPESNRRRGFIAWHRGGRLSRGSGLRAAAAASGSAAASGGARDVVFIWPTFLARQTRRRLDIAVASRGGFHGVLRGGFHGLCSLCEIFCDEGMTPLSSILAYLVPAKEEARSKDTQSPQGPALRLGVEGKNYL
jgi:hypothetical protein